jgi:hypothetical protein
MAATDSIKRTCKPRSQRGQGRRSFAAQAATCQQDLKQTAKHFEVEVRSSELRRRQLFSLVPASVGLAQAGASHARDFETTASGLHVLDLR